MKKRLVCLLAALVLIFGLYPLIRKGMKSPQTMWAMLTVLSLMAVGYLAFVSLYPFPPGTDAANLASGTKNAWKMVGCMLGLLCTYGVDRRTDFDTRAPLPGQIAKLVVGFALLLAIKEGARTPLQALFANDYLADGLRYFLMVVFAGCAWPRTFPLWKNIGKR